MSVNKILDHDVKVIKRDIAKLIVVTKEQYDKAYDAVVNNDYELAEEVIKKDKKINDMQNDFTSMALWKIAKQQMVASDLRLAVGSIIISREIEKVADYAKNICWYLVEFKPRVEYLEYIKNNFHWIIKMLDQIMILINQYDTDMSSKVKEFESEVNKEFLKARGEIISRIRDTKTDDEALELYSALRQFKKLERAAEHILSIQEILEFIRNGRFEDSDKYKKIIEETK